MKWNKTVATVISLFEKISQAAGYPLSSGTCDMAVMQAGFGAGCRWLVAAGRRHTLCSAQLDELGVAYSFSQIKLKASGGVSLASHKSIQCTVSLRRPHIPLHRRIHMFDLAEPKRPMNMSETKYYSAQGGPSGRIVLAGLTDMIY